MSDPESVDYWRQRAERAERKLARMVPELFDDALDRHPKLTPEQKLVVRQVVDSFIKVNEALSRRHG